MVLPSKNKILKTAKRTNRNYNYNKLFLSLTSVLLLSPYASANNGTSNNSEDTLIVTSKTEGYSGKNIVESDSAAGTKSLTPLIKTPQSISVINRAQIEAQGATSVADALNYSSGVVTNYRGSSNRNDEVITRGFRYAPKFLDGLSYGNQLDPWLLERVELVHGPASVLYGQVSPGGLINMTSKRPTAEAIRKVQMKAGNQSLGELAFDFGGALGDDIPVLYRLNGIVSTQKQFVKDYKKERIAIAPALTWIPNDNTTFTLLSSYQYDPKAGFRNFYPKKGTVTAVPNAGYIPYKMNLSEPSFNQSRREQSSIGYIFEHDINDVFSFQQNLRYSRANERFKLFVYVSDVKDLPTSIQRRPQREYNKTQSFNVDNQLKALFSTSNIDHNVISGIDYKWADSLSRRWYKSGSQYDFDWSNPVWGIPVNENELSLSLNDKKKLYQLGAYVQDQLSWENWNLVLSGRYDWTETKQQNLLKNTSTTQKDRAFTGRAGLLYAFDNGISPYISYSTSFEPNLSQGAPGTPAFKPTTGEQTEIGIKFQPKDSDTLLTLSLFDITQKNVTTSNPVTRFSEQIGKIGSKGAEAEIHSQITPEINLIASYTYTDTKTKDDGNTSRIGKRIPSVPEHAASAWGSYSFTQTALKGFTLGAGIRYTGSTSGDYAETFHVKPYTLYDLMAKYDLGEASPQLKGANVQLNVNNLTNKRYVASCSNVEACFYGSGRSIVATVEYTW
ncbi:TonB-dependent siderophore receptor [Xenorhabdus griffiniae]|uniref:TonB-dependent siderophore receptor n=1 Tax=Xenorhabdus griffiniae TaxID=351672 RepID=A0ABY9XGC0_9GAMM|nr:TonB-dependent siderophore receptor [Xenorhabdus griffiniae]MBD1227996.1 TonB-dependent siderophore receptor [Xenorhabdus griffiniae]MBE8587443.1 TonB-dependent siderophore receptor [Xenorhabdus griffiniae]WMV71966.1 TonB-dependent siderophore receptor [Xenorhabdus griffiniae]WNH01643.1 TonB-dependent siderophore receptor [Xenorhabdus griffiniae]